MTETAIASNNRRDAASRIERIARHHLKFHRLLRSQIPDNTLPSRSLILFVAQRLIRTVKPSRMHLLRTFTADAS